MIVNYNIYSIFRPLELAFIHGTNGTLPGIYLRPVTRCALLERISYESYLEDGIMERVATNAYKYICSAVVRDSGSQDSHVEPLIVRAPPVLCSPVSGFIIAKANVIYLLQLDALPRVRLKLAQDQSRCWMPKSEGCSEMMYYRLITQ